MLLWCYIFIRYRVYIFLNLIIRIHFGEVKRFIIESIIHKVVMCKISFIKKRKATAIH